MWHEIEQDGRLAPAYFSPNYNYFNQLFQTVWNKTTVLNLAFKSFSKQKFQHWFLYFIQQVITIFRWESFVSIAWKIRKRTLLCFRKFRLSKNFKSKREISWFPIEQLLSHSIKEVRTWTLLFLRKSLVPKFLWIRRGKGVSPFSVENFCLTLPKNFVGESFIVSLFSGTESVFV